MKEYFKKLNDFIHGVVAKIKSGLHYYFFEDWGINEDKFNRNVALIKSTIHRIVTSKITITIVVLLITPFVGILFAGSILAISLTYPLITVIWVCFSILIILYTFKDETFFDNMEDYYDSFKRWCRVFNERVS